MTVKERSLLSPGFARWGAHLSLSRHLSITRFLNLPMDASRFKRKRGRSRTHLPFGTAVIQALS